MQSAALFEKAIVTHRLLEGISMKNLQPTIDYNKLQLKCKNYIAAVKVRLSVKNLHRRF